MLTKLVDKKWRISEQADDIWMQYKKLVSEVKQFHKDKFARFKFEKDQLDTFFFETLNQQKTYEGLWCIIQLLLTLSHGQAAVERGFLVNKDILAPNLKALSLTALCLIHDSISAGQIEITDYIITDELLTSFSHESNRYKMYLIEKTKIRNLKNKEKESSSRRVDFQQRKEKQLQVTAQKLVDSADKKAKEAEKENRCSYTESIAESPTAS